MKIIKTNNNADFKGIKLSRNGRRYVKDVASRINCGEFSFIEKRKEYVSNTFNDKRKVFSVMRADNAFDNDEFGVLYLPWSKEAYIVSNPLAEQRLFPIVKKLDEDASLNLLL
jgi:hypothetical protein